jgi:hypothetical protein
MKARYVAMAMILAVTPIIDASALPISSLYLSVRVQGGICSVGAVGDEDGLNRRPYAEWTDALRGGVIWSKELDIPERFYEGRATHCLRERDWLFVLLQLDTHSQRSMAQGVLRLVKLRVADGFVESDTEVLVPRAGTRYSAWVDEGPSNLRVEEGRIVVGGKYRYLDTDEEGTSFSVMLEM